jgi:hypothetical protein
MVQREKREGPSPTGRLVVDLVDKLDEIQKIHREIGRVNSKTQVEYLMKNRENLLAKAEDMKARLASKVPDYDPISLRFFQCFYNVLRIYGRGVCESILWSFECEGHQPLDVVNFHDNFFVCVGKVLGKKSSKRIESEVLLEISNEFGMQLSSRANISDAFRIARSSLQHGEEMKASRNRAAR